MVEKTSDIQKGKSKKLAGQKQVFGQQQQQQDSSNITPKGQQSETSVMTDIFNEWCRLVEFIDQIHQKLLQQDQSLSPLLQKLQNYYNSQMPNPNSSSQHQTMSQKSIPKFEQKQDIVQIAGLLKSIGKQKIQIQSHLNAVTELCKQRNFQKLQIYHKENYEQVIEQIADLQQVCSVIYLVSQYLPAPSSKKSLSKNAQNGQNNSESSQEEEDFNWEQLYMTPYSMLDDTLMESLDPYEHLTVQKVLYEKQLAQLRKELNSQTKLIESLQKDLRRPQPLSLGLTDSKLQNPMQKNKFNTVQHLQYSDDDEIEQNNDDIYSTPSQKRIPRESSSSFQMSVLGMQIEDPSPMLMSEWMAGESIASANSTGRGARFFEMDNDLEETDGSPTELKWHGSVTLLHDNSPTNEKDIEKADIQETLRLLLPSNSSDLKKPFD